MKILHKIYSEHNQDMYKNKDVEEFIQRGNLSELNLIERGPHSNCYEFFNGVTNEDFDISASNTVLLVSSEYTARDLNDLQRKTIPLAKDGINIAPVIQYSPLKEYTKKTQFESSINPNKLYTMGIVQPRVYGMKAFTPTINETITKFNFINNMKSAQIVKAFDDIIKITQSGVKLDMENPKNIIINRYGVHFIDYEPSNNMHHLQNNSVYIIETLVDFFNHLIGTHVELDKISFVKPRYKHFINTDRIFDDKQREEYQALQFQSFYKCAKSLLISAYRSGIEDVGVLTSVLKSYQINYFGNGNNKQTSEVEVDDSQLI